MIALFYSHRTRRRAHLASTFLGTILVNATIVIVPFLFLCVLGPVVHQLNYGQAGSPEPRTLDDATMMPPAPAAENPAVRIEDAVAASIPVDAIIVPQLSDIDPQSYGFISRWHRFRDREAALLRQSFSFTRTGLGFSEAPQDGKSAN